MPPAEPADVVVVGSGGAGLLAALGAAARGARVLVLERAPVLGGTTAISGGTLWIPASDRAAEAGVADRPDDALAYLCAGGGESVDRPLLSVFAASARAMLRFAERVTPLRSVLGPQGDYHPELPGGRRGGRSLVPAPFDPAPLGEWRTRIRSCALPLDAAEELGSLAPVPLAPAAGGDGAERWTRGRALVGALVQGCLGLGVRFSPARRAERLLTAARGGRVVGVEVASEGRRERVSARRAVVLASGGFEWDPALVARFLPSALEAPGSPPQLEGDGLRMAMAAGASLGSMGEAWWSPMIRVPGERYDGEPFSRMVVSQRLYPRSIVVNRRGERFANEAQSYHDFGRELVRRDLGSRGPANRPAWLVYDAVYRHRYGTACVGATDPDPAWLRPEPTLEALAQRHGIDAPALAATIARWNRDVSRGRDSLFARGESAYALEKGDRSQQGLARTLGPIEAPPFYAVPLLAGALGTRGGPQTDVDGRVRDSWGGLVPGLFAAGNVAASPTGTLYPGAGGTLGLALTFGWRAGQAAAVAPPAEWT